jgi:predicted DNA-binding transcriptional regulator YafY
MMDSKLIEDAQPCPIKVIGTRSIVNKQYLPKQSLARKENLETLETAIREGQLLRLDYITGSGSFPDRSHGTFQVYPLQILFHNIAWYLGYEEAGGERDRHLYFERLDRLVINEKPTKKRDIKNQK